MLERGCEDDNLYPRLRDEDGARKFLKERRIKWWFQRHYDSVGSSGPTRNMASSQIMCINFLLPLARIPGALTAAVRAIDDDVVRVVDIHHEGRVSPVEFEWIGVPKSLEGTNNTGPVHYQRRRLRHCRHRRGPKRLPDGVEICRRGE